MKILRVPNGVSARTMAQELADRTGNPVLVSRNPVRYPKVGEIWHGIRGDHCEIKAVIPSPPALPKRVTVLQLDTGHRITSEIHDFLATYYPPAGRTRNRRRRNPKGGLVMTERQFQRVPVHLVRETQYGPEIRAFDKRTSKIDWTPVKIKGRKRTMRYNARPTPNPKRPRVDPHGLTGSEAFTGAERPGPARFPGYPAVRISGQGWPTKAAAEQAAARAKRYDPRVSGVMKDAGWWRISYLVHENPSRGTRRELSVPEKHQLRIARDSFKYTPGMLRVVGGPSHAEAREIIYRLTGKYPNSPNRRRFRHIKIRQGRNPIPRGIDPRSIRTVRRGSTRIRIGCPKGKYSARRRRCRVGTRAIEKLKPLRRRARNNPRKRGELARARRTFKTWHEFPAKGVRRVKGPPRVIPKTLVQLGEAVGIDYRSNKYEGRMRTYTHKFKRPRPILTTDPDAKNLHLVGGNVKITADGLEN